MEPMIRIVILRLLLLLASLPLLVLSSGCEVHCNFEASAPVLAVLAC